MKKAVPMIFLIAVLAGTPAGLPAGGAAIKTNQSAEPAVFHKEGCVTATGLACKVM